MAATYERSGVSLEKAGTIVSRLAEAVALTRTDAVVADLGGFAGLYRLDDERLLAASTDGVGTKLILSRRHGRLREAGMDLAAHCINDVATTGARPLFFLDYVASSSVDLDQLAMLVEGAAAVCRSVGCAILGGETAEMPDVYQGDELDFVGTCVGLVESAELLGVDRVREGDVLLGLPSSGLHANGFTLVRQVLGDDEPDPDLLLAPTRLYSSDVEQLRAQCDLHALAHITGGGIPENLARVIPAGLQARVETTSWPRPAVFDWLSDRGVSEAEQRRVFNLGVGMCAVVSAASASDTAFPVIGRVEAGVGRVILD